jgi:hypothetical protein
MARRHRRLWAPARPATTKRHDIALILGMIPLANMSIAVAFGLRGHIGV